MRRAAALPLYALASIAGAVAVLLMLATGGLGDVARWIEGQQK